LRGVHHHHRLVVALHRDLDELLVRRDVDLAAREEVLVGVRSAHRAQVDAAAVVVLAGQ